MTLTVKGNSLIKNTSELARKSTTAKPTPEQVKAGAAKTSDSASGSASLFDANGNLIIPDAKFLNALIEQGIDTNGDGKISKTEAEAVSSFGFGLVGKGISDLTGIQAFTALKELNASDNSNLVSINLQGNSKLTTLKLLNTNITAISLKKNTALTSLNINGSKKLESLDLSVLPSLTTLYCTGCPKLYAIKVSQKQLDNIPSDWHKDQQATYTVNPEDCPSFSINKTMLGMGNVNVGKSISKKLTITNNGTGNLILTACTISGSNASEFSCNMSSSITVAAHGGTHELSVTFAPTTEASAKTATLTIKSNVADVTVSLKGQSALGTLYVLGTDYTLSDGNKTLKKWLGAQTTVDMTKDSVLNKLTKIGSGAFNWESKAQTIVLGKAITEVDSSAFFECDTLSSVTLNEGLTTLGDSCFAKTQITDIILPASLTTINSGDILYRCYNLPEIKVASGNASFKSKNGIVYSKDGSKIYLYPQGKTETSFTFPSGVTSMTDKIFMDNKNLERITLSEGIATVPMAAFSHAEKVKTLTLPSSLTSLEDWACNNMKALTTVNCKATTPPSVYTGSYNDTFRNTDLSKVTLYVPVGSKSKYQNADGWKDFGVITEKSF